MGNNSQSMRRRNRKAPRPKITKTKPSTIITKHPHDCVGCYVFGSSNCLWAPNITSPNKHWSPDK